MLYTQQGGGVGTDKETHPEGEEAAVDSTAADDQTRQGTPLSPGFVM